MADKKFEVGNYVRIDIDAIKATIVDAGRSWEAQFSSNSTVYNPPWLSRIAAGADYTMLVVGVTPTSFSTSVGGKNILKLEVKVGSVTSEFSAYDFMFKPTGKSIKLRKVAVGNAIKLRDEQYVRFVTAITSDGSLHLTRSFSLNSSGYVESSDAGRFYEGYTSVSPMRVEKVFRTPPQPKAKQLLKVKGHDSYNGSNVTHVQAECTDDVPVKPVFVRRFHTRSTGTTAEYANGWVYYISPSSYKVIAEDVVARRSATERDEIRQEFRRRVNSANITTPDYRHGHRRGPKMRAAFKLLGVTIADCVNARITLRELADVCNSNHILHSSAYIAEQSMKQAGITGLFRCDNCGTFELEGNGGDVYNGIDYDAYCDHCYSTDTVYSDVMGERINLDSAYSYFDSESSYTRQDPDYVLERYADSNGFYYYDGSYFDEDTAYDLGLTDDDDDDDDDSSVIKSYHGTTRRWVPAGGTKQYPCLGLEVEVYAPNRSRASTAVREAFRSSEVYMERDGSLDDYHGFEIITQPWGKEIWEKNGPRLLSTLTKEGVVAYNHPDSSRNYGIHINLAREGLTAMQEVRMFMFFADQRNIDFVRAMAQREQIYHPDVGIGSLSSPKKLYERGKNYNKKYQGLGKYCPVNMRESVLEFRVFQSTLAVNSFMKNLELVWALYDWTRHPTGVSWNHVDFVTWLSSRPQVEKDYPNLMAYLRKPEYRIKRGHRPIKNTWLDIVRPAVRSSIVITQDEEQLKAA